MIVENKIRYTKYWKKIESHSKLSIYIMYMKTNRDKILNMLIIYKRISIIHFPGKKPDLSRHPNPHTPRAISLSCHPNPYLINSLFRGRRATEVTVLISHVHRKLFCMGFTWSLFSSTSTSFDLHCLVSWTSTVSTWKSIPSSMCLALCLSRFLEGLFRVLAVSDLKILFWTVSDSPGGWWYWKNQIIKFSLGLVIIKSLKWRK